MSNTRRSLLVGASAFAAACATAQAPVNLPTPVASTRYGKVSGYRDKGVSAFKGIPYGSDTSLRRFKAPVPPDPWTGVKECTAFGPRAPQAEGGSSAGFLPRRDPEDPVGEDCLKLNVWTPAVGPGKRPVLVYIHGGGFSTGAANSDLYDGVNLSRKGDVVVVTLNHRLNLFGYLYLGEAGGEEFADSGCVGQLDLILALEWVRDNIAEFGGDAGNVLIFGQSGGGAKSSVLMAMPAARGLFQKVMTMSGQQVTVMPRDMAAGFAHTVLERDKLTPQQMKTMPMADLIRASRGGTWTPVLDGRNILRDPFEPDATPLSRDIPLIMGNTRDETTLLIGGSDPFVFDLTWDQVAPKLDQHVKSYLGGIDAQRIVQWYRDRFPDYGPTRTFIAATTAWRSWRAQIVQANRRAEQPAGAAPTWIYQFDWQSPVAGGKWGATHTADIPFFFDNIEYGASMNGTGPRPQALANKMSDVLLAYARTGNPNCTAIPNWSAYDLKSRATMVFDDKPHFENDPRGDERRLVSIVPYRQPGT